MANMQNKIIASWIDLTTMYAYTKGVGFTLKMNHLNDIQYTCQYSCILVHKGNDTEDAWPLLLYIVLIVAPVAVR